jgi:DNA-binding beta-propeller fold protein YncE
MCSNKSIECKKKMKSLTVIIFYVIVGLFLAGPGKANSQTQGPSVTYLDSITQDEEGGKIYFPSQVFAEPVRKEIYIIDSKSRIIIYTSDFFPVFTLDKGYGVENPQGLTVDAAGNLYVAESATKDNPRNKISVFNACLKWVRDIYLEGFEGAETFVPYRMALDKKGNLYVASSYFPGILILNSEGRLLQVFPVEDEGKKVNVNNVTVDEAGRIYIVSEEEGHIYVYDENRKFLFRFGEKGGSSGKLSRPMAVAIDNRSGRIFALDYMRHTVSTYDKDGKYLSEFGGLGWGEGWFQHPRDIAVDSSARILVADTFNDRIEVFQTNE